jgi:hypothetical protein
MSTPFRWDIAKREQLGQLPNGEMAPSYEGLVEELRLCCARVIAMCSDSDLFFVGRSPESLFDYLSGVFAGTSWSTRCALLNISMRDSSVDDVTREEPAGLAAMREQLQEARLDPLSLVGRARAVAFVDLVDGGSTFGHLHDLLLNSWSQQGADTEAMRRKIRFVGITERTKTSPNTWRWQQHADWTNAYPANAIRNVSITPEFWHYLGNTQLKLTPSNPPWRWADPGLREPPRDDEHLGALRLAVHIYDRGSERSERKLFSQALAEQAAMKESWFRSLVGDLRR